ncbi:hypothetical protein LX36DRAFT_664384 [Colletotrichum falcatum]|nr:hypothetical protein LX36DRAFT_664384 [Colletotrichum falcatum]
MPRCPCPVLSCLPSLTSSFASRTDARVGTSPSGQGTALKEKGHCGKGQGCWRR